MRLPLFLSYGAVFWVAAIIGAPLLVSSGSAAAVIAGAVAYRAASVVCHQIPERSFHVSVLPLAVCARCFGLYIGAAAASMAVTLVGSGVRRPGSGVRNVSGPWSGMPLLAIAALPTAVSWSLERAGFWSGGNAVRFAAALPLGLAAAWIVLAALQAETADTID